MKRLWRGLLARGRNVLFRRRADREMDEEIRFHIDMETEKLVGTGLDPAEARRRARAAFGGVERYRQRLREERRIPFLEPLWHDLRFGGRAVVREPGLALVATLTIGLGVGATTTVFSAVEATLLRPLPIPRVDRLVSIEERRVGMTSSGPEGMRIPYVRYEAYRDASGAVFASLAAYHLADAFSLRLPDATVAVSGAVTSGNYFHTLGVRPVLGRAYHSGDAAEIVISHHLWTSRFGADPSVVGSTVTLDGKPMTIVGVAPVGFKGATFMAAEVWKPVSARGEQTAWMVPVGRLRAGVSLRQATAVVDALAKRIPPRRGTTVRSARVERLHAVPGQGRTYLEGIVGALQGMALFVLLLAAANIAGVMLARGLARRRETAVRLALGAGRVRIARHLLAETFLLFAGGGLVGMGLAWLGARWLSHLPVPPQVPHLIFAFRMDRPVIAFALIVTGLTAALFGLLPALAASRSGVAPILKAGGGGATGGHEALRNVFVGGQVALAVALLLIATLFARSLWEGLRTQVGFDARGLVTATIGVPGSAAEGRSFRQRLGKRIRALPGVEEVAWVADVPMSGDRNNGDVRRPDAPDAGYANASYNVVSPGYFRTMGIPIIAGRGFTPADDEGAQRSVVINEALAERLWPGRSPLGHRLSGVVGDAVVVGVTPTGRYRFVTETPTPFAYLSSTQVYRSTMALEIRAPGAEARTLRALPGVVRDMNPDIAVEMPGREADLVGIGLFPLRIAAQLIGAFGLAGLLLAAMGIYGILAYQVSRRTRELGIRRALGATARHVTWGVVRGGAILAALGCVLGMAVGAALARAVRSFLYGVHPLDPVTFTAVPALLFAVALLASWLPARRAASVGASEALRSE